ncbi:hypothetical protein CR513_12405, partial [Mucuna pruriens]
MFAKLCISKQVPERVNIRDIQGRIGGRKEHYYLFIYMLSRSQFLSNTKVFKSLRFPELGHDCGSKGASFGNQSCQSSSSSWIQEGRKKRKTWEKRRGTKGGRARHKLKVEQVVGCINLHGRKVVRLVTLEFGDYALVWWTEVLEDIRRGVRDPFKDWVVLKNDEK